MSLNRPLGIVAIAALMAVQAIANQQDRPNFSGVWKLESVEWRVPPKTAAGDKPAPPGGAEPEITIRHAAESLIITRYLGGMLVPVRHVFDGSETRVRTPARLCRADSEGTWTAAWVDNSVAITMVAVGREGGGPSIPNDVKTTLRLESPERLRVDVDFRVGGGVERVVRSAQYTRLGSPSVETSPPPDPQLKATISQIAWLAGVWTGKDRANGPEEVWTEPASGSMQAVGRVRRDGRLSSFEFLCIAERSGSLVYLAMPEGRMPPTEFKLTHVDEARVSFENPAHSYPKNIEYVLRPDGTLEARISGDAKQRRQTFVYVRSPS